MELFSIRIRRTFQLVSTLSLVSGFFFNVFHQISEIILNYHTLRTYWLPPKIKGVVKAPSNNLSLNIQIALCLSAFQGYLVHDLTHLLRCHLGVNLRGGNVLVFQISLDDSHVHTHFHVQASE